MSMTITWTLGEILSKIRRDAGLDQATLSARVGIARNSLSNYERGRSIPPFDVAVRIAAACDVPVELLASVVANAETAPAEARAVSNEVRPKGLEPLTF